MDQNFVVENKKKKDELKKDPMVWDQPKKDPMVWDPPERSKFSIFYFIN